MRVNVYRAHPRNRARDLAPLLLATAASLVLLVACGSASDATTEQAAPTPTPAPALSDPPEAPQPSVSPPATGPAAEAEIPPAPDPLTPESRYASPDDPTDRLLVPDHGWQTDFTMRTVRLDSFVAGGPGKDGIPAIDNPAFESVEAAAATIKPHEPVIEVQVGGETRIYPIKVLVWHEIVNDEIQGVPVVVTFCPLCNTAQAFERTVAGNVLEFGVSGVLRNSDLVMFDRETETWWQQFGGDAVVGELSGERLTPIPAAIVAFEVAAANHPDAMVLSRETGFSRPYDENPYPGYDAVDLPPFFYVENRDELGRIPPRERVVFISIDGEAVAVPFTALEAAKTLDVEVGGRSLTVIWQEGVTSTLDDTEIFEFGSFGTAPERDEPLVTGSADVIDTATSERVVFDTPFWFTVAAFSPDIEIIRG